jgi:hypothetical protein
VDDRAVADRFAATRMVSSAEERVNAMTDSSLQSSAVKSPVPNVGCSRRKASMLCIQCSSDVGCASCASTFVCW